MATNPEEEDDGHVSDGPVAVLTRTVREVVVENPRSWLLIEALVIIALAVMASTLAWPWYIFGVAGTTLLALLVGRSPAPRR